MMTMMMVVMRSSAQQRGKESVGQAGLFCGLDAGDDNPAAAPPRLRVGWMGDGTRMDRGCEFKIGGQAASTCLCVTTARTTSQS